VALYGGLGVAVAIQNAFNQVWGVPVHRRPDPIRARLRSLLLLGLLGLGVLHPALRLAGPGTATPTGSAPPACSPSGEPTWRCPAAAFAVAGRDAVPIGDAALTRDRRLRPATSATSATSPDAPRLPCRRHPGLVGLVACRR